MARPCRSSYGILLALLALGVVSPHAPQRVLMPLRCNGSERGTSSGIHVGFQSSVESSLAEVTERAWLLVKVARLPSLPELSAVLPEEALEMLSRNLQFSTSCRQNLKIMLSYCAINLTR